MGRPVVPGDVRASARARERYRALPSRLLALAFLVCAVASFALLARGNPYGRFLLAAAIGFGGDRFLRRLSFAEIRRSGQLETLRVRLPFGHPRQLTLSQLASVRLRRRALRSPALVLTDVTRRTILLPLASWSREDDLLDGIGTAAARQGVAIPADARRVFDRRAIRRRRVLATVATAAAALGGTTVDAALDHDRVRDHPPLDANAKPSQLSRIRGRTMFPFTGRPADLYVLPLDRVATTAARRVATDARAHGRRVELLRVFAVSETAWSRARRQLGAAAVWHQMVDVRGDAGCGAVVAISSLSLWDESHPAQPFVRRYRRRSGCSALEIVSTARGPLATD